MRTETIQESLPVVLALAPEEAAKLVAIGARLASQTTWWGAPEPDADATDPSVIRVRPVGAGLWEVRVSDAVGVVVAGDLALFVEPKIPRDHLLYLLTRSGDLPRIDEEAAQLAAATSLWELVAHAFVIGSERLLRLGLVRDYQELTDTLDAATGRVEVLGTAAHFYAGRLALDCVYDDFSFDTPLNRTILAATRTVAESALLPAPLRLRAIRIAAQMSDVGVLRPPDVTVELDRRTAHYDGAHRLALHILRHVGRHLAAGTTPAWSFLVRTPEMVERGLLAVLQDQLGEKRVRKGGRELPGTKVKFNPDLVFDNGKAVGDVKYKLSSGDWDRADLYQSIAFAEAYGAERSVLVRFRDPATAPLPDLTVGRKTIREVTWITGSGMPVANAASLVASQVAEWLDGETGVPLSA